MIYIHKGRGSLFKKIVFTSVASLLILSSVVSPSISYASNQNIDEIKEDRKEVKSKLTNAERELTSVIKEKKQIEEEITQLTASIKANSEALDDVTSEIDEVNEEIEIIEEQIEERFDILKDRAKAYQANGGNIQYLEVLFGAASFSEFISRFTAVTTIADADATLIEEQENDKRKVEMKLSELEDLQVELEEMEELMTEQREMALQMEEELERKDKELNSLITELKVEEEKLAALEASVSTEVSAPASIQGGGKLGWPTLGGYISSHMGQRWGRLHKGIDIARTDRSTSPPIFAAESGTVETATFNHGGYGNLVIINHGNGLKTLYAHMASLTVSPGQKVAKGDQLGIMGNTGDSKGIHLHFEVHVNGSLQNPMGYLK